MISQKMDKTDGNEQAYAAAMFANLIDFPSRRGGYVCDEIPVVCLYNNNPYSDFPGLRAEELVEFRAALKEEEILEIGFASYPPESEESAGYTYAILLQGDEITLDWAIDTMQEITYKALNRAAADKEKYPKISPDQNYGELRP